MSISKKIGITGGSGLLGKILIKILKKKKIKYSVFKKDIRNPKEIKRWLISNKNIDIIFHLAAIVPIKYVNNNRKKSIDVNFNGTKNLYKIIYELDKKIWFFFASTAHVYQSKNKPLKEKDNLKPITFYGKTKLMSEKFLLKNRNKR